MDDKRKQEAREKIDTVIEEFLKISLNAFQVRRDIKRIQREHKEAMSSFSFSDMKRIAAEIQDLESDMRAHNMSLTRLGRTYEQIRKEYPDMNFPPLPDDMFD